MSTNLSKKSVTRKTKIKQEEELKNSNELTTEMMLDYIDQISSKLAVVKGSIQDLRNKLRENEAIDISC